MPIYTSRVRVRVHGKILGTCLEERSEYRFRVLEVVMDDVDEETGIHKLGYYFPRGGFGVVEISPLLA